VIQMQALGVLTIAMNSVTPAQPLGLLDITNDSDVSTGILSLLHALDQFVTFCTLMSIYI